MLENIANQIILPNSILQCHLPLPLNWSKWHSFCTTWFWVWTLNYQTPSVTWPILLSTKHFIIRLNKKFNLKFPEQHLQKVRGYSSQNIVTTIKMRRLVQAKLYSNDNSSCQKFLKNKKKVPILTYIKSKVILNLPPVPS